MTIQLRVSLSELAAIFEQLPEPTADQARYQYEIRQITSPATYQSGDAPVGSVQTTAGFIEFVHDTQTGKWVLDPANLIITP
jgi:hypothetical protein